jgi:hypothetical protein
MRHYRLVRIVAALICLFAAGTIRAEQPTIHVFLLFCDAYPEAAGAINTSVSADRDLVKPLFRNFVSAKAWEVKLNIIEISGADATLDNIEQRFAAMTASVASDDTVYMHFSGHGAILDANKGEQFLQTCDLQLLSRKKIADQLAELPCRLRILITDCCSTYPEAGLVAEGDAKVDPWNNFYYLLMRHRGFVNITAASPGQAAYGKNNGGFLTVNLESDIQRFRTWKEVFESTRDRVFEETTEDLVAGEDPEIYGQRPFAYSLGEPLANFASEKTLPTGLQYQIPDSDRLLLDPLDVEEMTLQQLYLARNEIFARHGYDFSSEMLTDYFANRSWYQKRDGFKSPSLSEIEKRNAALILKVEKEFGGPFVTSTTLPDKNGNSNTTTEPADIFAHSSDQVLPRTVVQSLSLAQLSIARNEIYARHGFPFSSRALQEYFALKSYYRRTPSATDPKFNAVEAHNLWLIRKIERIKGGPYKW